jgi:hypothetical protein
VTGTIKLVGPGLLALIALAILIWAMSGFVTVDSLRRRRTDYAGVFESRWFYTLPQALFFVVFVAWQVPWIPAHAPWVGDLLIIIPLILAQQMAYFLRVVFPTSKRLELRLDAECALLREPDEEPVEGAAVRAAAARPSDEDGFFDPDRPEE